MIDSLMIRTGKTCFLINMYNVYVLKFSLPTLFKNALCHTCACMYMSCMMYDCANFHLVHVLYMYM